VSLQDTKDPSGPTDASGLAINASNDESYNLTVTLPDDHEAGTLAVDLTNGDTVPASQYVASENDSDSDSHVVSFTGLDVNSLDNGTVTVDATLTDDGGNVGFDTGLPSITKDADPPGLADVHPSRTRQSIRAPRSSEPTTLATSRPSPWSSTNR